jgi:hypothetical protein
MLASRLSVTLAALTLAGCATSAVKDTLPPTLEVSSPSRGTLASGTTVTVAGHVADDGSGLLVTVNGLAATVGTDGAFSATVPLAPGIAILETLATDRAGNVVRDVRAVLGGNLLPTGRKVKDALGAHLGTAGLTTIGHAVGVQVARLDLTAAVAAANPVYDNGGCLGAKVDVTKVTVGGVGLELVPGAGALATHVVLTNVEVDLHASYKVACIGGSTNLKLTSTKVRVDGDLGVAINGHSLRSSLANPTVALDGFHLDVGGLPGAVDNLISGAVHDRVATALVGVIHDRVPPMADAALAQLVGASFTAAVGGVDVTVAVTPTSVAIGAGGLDVAVDGTATVKGGDGGMFLSSPAPVAGALARDDRGLGVAIADDLLNNLFSGLWAAGALDQHLAVDASSPLLLFLDDATRSLDVEFSLPPTLAGDGAELRLAVGDLIVVARDQAGTELSRFAMSISTTLAADSTAPGGALALRLGDPTVKAQVISESAAVTKHLDGPKLEGLVSGVWGLVAPMADDALASVTLPSVGGVSVAAPSLAGKGSFAVLSAGVTGN